MTSLINIAEDNKELFDKLMNCNCSVSYNGKTIHEGKISEANFTDDINESKLLCKFDIEGEDPYICTMAENEAVSNFLDILEHFEVSLDEALENPKIYNRLYSLALNMPVMEDNEDYIYSKSDFIYHTLCNIYEHNGKTTSSHERTVTTFKSSTERAKLLDPGTGGTMRTRNYLWKMLRLLNATEDDMDDINEISDGALKVIPKSYVDKKGNVKLGDEEKEFVTKVTAKDFDKKVPRERLVSVTKNKAEYEPIEGAEPITFDTFCKALDPNLANKVDLTFSDYDGAFDLKTDNDDNKKDSNNEQKENINKENQKKTPPANLDYAQFAVNLGIIEKTGEYKTHKVAINNKIIDIFNKLYSGSSSDYRLTDYVIKHYFSVNWYQDLNFSTGVWGSGGVLGEALFVFAFNNYKTFQKNEKLFWQRFKEGNANTGIKRVPQEWQAQCRALIKRLVNSNGIKLPVKFLSQQQPKFSPEEYLAVHVGGRNTEYARFYQNNVKNSINGADITDADGKPIKQQAWVVPNAAAIQIANIFNSPNKALAKMDKLKDKNIKIVTGAHDNWNKCDVIFIKSKGTGENIYAERFERLSNMLQNVLSDTNEIDKFLKNKNIELSVDETPDEKARRAFNAVLNEFIYNGEILPFSLKKLNLNEKGEASDAKIYVVNWGAGEVDPTVEFKFDTKNVFVKLGEPKGFPKNSVAGSLYLYGSVYEDPTLTKKQKEKMNNAKQIFNKFRIQFRCQSNSANLSIETGFDNAEAKLGKGIQNTKAELKISNQDVQKMLQKYEKFNKRENFNATAVSIINCLNKSAQGADTYSEDWGSTEAVELGTRRCFQGLLNLLSVLPEHPIKSFTDFKKPELCQEALQELFQLLFKCCIQGDPNSPYFLLY